MNGEEEPLVYTPATDATRTHLPPTHCPFSLPPQSPGHCFSEQSSPANPGRQKQVPSWQYPFPKQWYGQSEMEQSTPRNPFWQ